MPVGQEGEREGIPSRSSPLLSDAGDTAVQTKVLLQIKQTPVS